MLLFEGGNLQPITNLCAEGFNIRNLVIPIQL
jgi:hypothetical protein